MRITVRQQVLLAPATVLLLLLLLLGFMQYTHWDLGRKRDQAEAIGSTFVALAEADMAARRLHLLLRTIQHTGRPAPEDMALVADLYERLLSAINRVEPFGPLEDSGQLTQLQQLVLEMNPANSPEPDRAAELFARFRSSLSTLSNVTQIHRNRLRLLQDRDVNAMVARTTAVSMAVLIAAIALGLSLSLYFSRRLMSRIQRLSRNAMSIADGQLDLPDAPARINDELDALAVAINRMTKRLIQVVGSEKLLEGAEEERRRIAMELHDQSLADLSGVLRGLQALEESPEGPEDRQQLTGLAGELEDAIANLRDIMDNLHPQTLDILGLGAALENHLEQHCQTPGAPEYHFYCDPKLESQNLSRIRQLTLYRIAVEAIQNVLKHSNAERFEVNLTVRENNLIMAVEDNGLGLNENQSQSGGRGLNNIRERARAIGADVAWKPARFYRGTRFELTLNLTQLAE